MNTQLEKCSSQIHDFAPAPISWPVAVQMAGRSHITPGHLNLFSVQDVPATVVFNTTIESGEDDGTEKATQAQLGQCYGGAEDYAGDLQVLAVDWRRGCRCCFSTDGADIPGQSDIGAVARLASGAVCGPDHIRHPQNGGIGQFLFRAVCRPAQSLLWLYQRQKAQNQATLDALVSAASQVYPVLDFHGGITDNAGNIRVPHQQTRHLTDQSNGGAS